MPIIDFVPKKPIKPLFAIKLSPSLQRLYENYEKEEVMNIIKLALNISLERIVEFKSVEDMTGELGIILIIYSHKHKIGSKLPNVSVPQTEQGFFDFKIYDLDFNKKLDIEKIIETSM